MEKLLSIFNKFRDIKASYEGESTDWKRKCVELKMLLGSIKAIKFKFTKNYYFLNYIRKNIERDIEEEYKRLKNLIAE